MLTQASLVSWSVPAAIRLLATICWRRIFAVALLLVLFVASPYSLAFCSCWGGGGGGVLNGWPLVTLPGHRR